MEHTTKLIDGQEGVRRVILVSCAERLDDLQPSTFNLQPDINLQPDASHPVLDFVASTGVLDRMDEVIEPEGWRLERYRANPVFQNAHRYGDVMFTLGKALKCEVSQMADGRKALTLRVQFATEVNPVARIAYGLYKGGFLKAVSVGFIPIRWEEGNDQTPWRRRYLEQELLEVSAVAIPANPEALALGIKSGTVSREDVLELAAVCDAALGPERGLRIARELHKVMCAN